MVGQNTGSGKSVFWLFVFVLILVIVFMNLPNLKQVRYGTHAVQKHGQDALTARASLKNCKNLKTKLCPGKQGGYGLTVVIWCETGLSTCPGMYTTIGGIEKTCFIRPCSQWSNCQ